MISAGGSRRDTNDAGARAFMPFVKSAVIARDDLLQNMRRDRDFIFSRVRRSKKDMIAANLNFRRVVPKITWSHLSTPIAPYTEQLENRRRLFAESNCNASNLICFRPTASNERRAA